MPYQHFDSDTEDSADRNPIEVVAEEFLECHRRGENPDAEAFADRHPQLAEEIRDLLPTLLMLESGRPSDGSSARRIGDGMKAHERLGDYVILREIGHGGMGIVYEARHESLGRRVALKVLNPRGRHTANEIPRFKREVKAAARLHHSHIVPIFGAGESDGIHYYVMQLIEGASLEAIVAELVSQLDGSRDSLPNDQSHISTVVNLMLGSDSTHADGPRGGDSDSSSSCRRQTADHALASVATGKLTPASHLTSSDKARLTKSLSGKTFQRTVATIGVQAAEALHYAHEHNVLHRDVKPGNLLLDVNGDVWFADFGLAKTADQANLTRTGDVIGTLRYMAPEPFRGQTDCRSDVFGLGLTLYELLALRPAYGEIEPRQLVALAMSGRVTALDELHPTIPRDLATIIHKTIEPEPGDRYQFAAELAADLERFLNDEPILARQPSLAERLVRWSKRHKTVAALLIFIAVLLISGTVVSSAAAVRFRTLAGAAEQARQQESAAKNNSFKARNEAITARNDAEAERTAADMAREKADEQRLLAEKQQDIAEEQTRLANEQRVLAEQHSQTIRRNLYASQMQVIGRLWQYSGGARLANMLLDKWKPNGGEADEDLRGWEWYFLRANVVQSETWWGGDPWKPVYRVVWSPDGKRQVSAGAAGKVDVWDAKTHKKLLTLPRRPGIVKALAWGPNGNKFATGGTGDTKVHVWDASSGKELAVCLGHTKDVTSLSLSPDGTIASSSTDGTVRLWNADGQQQGVIQSSYSVGQVVWNPAGTKLAVCNNEAHVTIFSRAGEKLETLTSSDVRFNSISSVAWSPDGSRIAAGTRDQLIVVWHVTPAGGQTRPPALLRGHQNQVTDVQWSPDGRYLASTAYDCLLIVWDMQSYSLGRRCYGHTHHVQSVAWNPSGETLITGSIDQSIREWQPRDPYVFREHDWGVAAVAFSPDGKLVASGGGDTTVRIWEAATRREVRILRGHFGGIRSLSWSRDGVLASTATDRTIRLWDPIKGEATRVLKSPDSMVHAVAWSSDGSRLATAIPGVVSLWRITPDAAEVVVKIERGGIGGYSIAWKPDGSRIVAGAYGASLVFDTSDGHEIKQLPGREPRGIHLVDWSRDGTRIAAIDYNQNLYVWDAATGKELVFDVRRHTMPPNSIAWHPDGTRVATAASDNTIRLSDSQSGAESLVLSHQQYVQDIAWSPDGLSMASASDDTTCRIWDSAPGYIPTPR